MRKDYDSELMKVRVTIKEMGEKTIASVLTAVASLVTKEVENAAASRQFEKEVDFLYRTVDEHCIVLIATQQPAAADLRFLVSSLKIASEIERIADYANNIAKTVQKKFVRLDTGHLEPLNQNLKEMGDLAANMLSDALRAYQDSNAELAEAVIKMDELVNKFHKSLFRGIIAIAATEPERQEAFLEFHTAVRYIERVADRATNIAEWVFYASTGYHLRK